MDRTDTVLVVGPAGDGGIDHYIRRQRRELASVVDVAVHRSYVGMEVEGLTDAVRYVLRSLVPLLTFPFRRPPTVVHVHTSHRFSFYRSGLYVFVASLRWDSPVVLHVHGSSFDAFLQEAPTHVRWFQQAVFERCDRIVVLSDSWAALLERYADPEKIRILPNAVDPTGFDPTYGADPPHVVFLSDLVERKGVGDLLAAVDRLARRRDLSFRVTVAGRGPLADDVAEFAERVEDVEYRGYVTEAEKRRLLEDASIVVLPTYAEGLPFVLLEGMAGGNAVVTTTVGSIPEVLGADNGVLVEPGDVDALADALERLVASPETAERMGRQNRQLVRESFSWDSVARRLVELYDEALGRRPDQPIPGR